MPPFAVPHNRWVYTCRPSLAVDFFYVPYPNSLAQKIQLAMDPLKWEWEEGESMIVRKVGLIGFAHMKEETTVYFLSQTGQLPFSVLFLLVTLNIFSSFLFYSK